MAGPQAANADGGASPDKPTAMLVSRAHALRSQGRLDEAIDTYRMLLKEQPRHAEAYNGLGIALARDGRLQEAVAAFRSAIEAAPNYPEACNNLGNALDELGHADEAISAYRDAIRLKPGYAKAYVNLAAALRKAGRADEAERASRTTVNLWPQNADAWRGLGAALRQQKRFGEAVGAFKRAVELQPDSAAFFNDLGDALQENEKPNEAETAYRTAISLRPDHAEALTNLGALLGDLGKFDEAESILRRAIELKPDLPEPRVNLGALLVTVGRFKEAEAVLRAVNELKPGLPEALTNLGSTLMLQSRPDEAVAYCREALTFDPDMADAHTALGETLIALGQYREGWREFEWRWKLRDWSMKPRTYPQLQWQGEPLEGRTILLYGEQGLGDVLQFSRFIEVVASMGGRVIAEVYPALRRLIATIPGVADVIVPGEQPPSFDLHLPLLSVPRVLGTTLETVPAQVPYLHPDAASVAKWSARLSHYSGPKVGLVWSGDPRPHDVRAHELDRRRSVALTRMVPLLETPGITFFSLQKGTPAAQLADIPDRLRPIDFMGEVSDFADTAALVANLDVVVTVCTSMVHLTGAIGKPVWVLSRFDAHSLYAVWRSMSDRESTPWYPTARLFRQSNPATWEDVVARIAAALSNYATSRPSA